jgi:hypothetical protein
VLGGGEVVATLDETDVGDEPDGVVLVQLAVSTTASTRSLRRTTTTPACPITDFTRLSYMVKLTRAALTGEGQVTQQ